MGLGLRCIEPVAGGLAAAAGSTVLPVPVNSLAGGTQTQTDIEIRATVTGTARLDSVRAVLRLPASLPR
jgi:hypothetical protein